MTAGVGARRWPRLRRFKSPIQDWEAKAEFSQNPPSGRSNDLKEGINARGDRVASETTYRLPCDGLWSLSGPRVDVLVSA